MMIEMEILKALQKATTAAVEASNMPALPVKYIGRVFEVPDGPYLETVQIPNNVIGEFWAEGKTYRGLFRLLLHWPVDDKGAYQALDVLGSIAAHFPIGAVFQSDGVSVKVYQQPDLTSVIEAAPELLYPLTIRYTSFQTP